MKKIINLTVITAALLLGATSCFERIDNWYTNTASFDGRFVVSQTCADENYTSDNYAIEDGAEVWIYNTAANKENEIIIDAYIAGLPVKIKGTAIGTSASFTIAEVANISSSDVVGDAVYFIYRGNFYNYNDWGDPEELGEEYEAIQFYTRVEVVEASITPKGATSIGGNVVDGLHLVLRLYTDSYVIESYETPQSTWADPDVPELAWRVQGGVRENADGFEEEWIIDGYRYTGYPEDDPTRQPPTITE
jgi:hypothetical protein